MDRRHRALGALSTLVLLLGCGPEQQQRAWPDLGVGIDKLGLEKTLVAESSFRGYVRSIQLGNFDGDTEVEIAVVPQTGVYLFDATSLKKKAQFDFKKPDGDTLWFGISPYLIRDKSHFSIAMLGGGYGDVGVLDRTGKQLWSFKPDPTLPPNGMVVDDAILGDPRFFACDRGTLYRLDRTGGVVWKVPEDAEYIALVRDTDATEAGFATAQSRSRTLSVWSAAGKRLQQTELPFHPDGLAFVRAGEVSGFVVKSGLQLASLDRSGKHRFTYSYEGVPVHHGPHAALVRLGADQPPVLAVRSTSRSATGKSVLTLLSLEGSPLYQEYMEGGPALGVVPVVNESRDKLLVGQGTEKLWSYEKASPKSSMQRTGASAGR